MKVIALILFIVLFIIFIIHLYREKNRMRYKYYEIQHYKQIVESVEFSLIRDYYSKSKNDIVNSINWLCSYYEVMVDLPLWKFMFVANYSSQILKSDTILHRQLNKHLIEDFLNDEDITHYLFKQK
jgi:hypothetical protein